MSMIKVIQSPQLFSPAANQNLFQIESDRAKLLYFNVQVLSDVNDSILANLKFFVLPNYPTGTFFDLSSILTNLVEPKIINSDNIIEDVPNLLMSYRLLISENFVDNGKVFQGDSLSVGSFKVWNAEINKVQYSNFNYNSYVVNPITSTAKFLTNKPLINNVYLNSNEYLYLLNDTDNSSVVIKFYSNKGIALGKRLIPIISQSEAIRINLSPKLFISSIGVTANQFQPVFQNVFGVNLSSYYTVHIQDSAGNPKSEIRTYIVKENKGCRTNFDLLFSNSLGGFDTLKLFDPKESISVESSTFKRYPYKLNNSNLISNFNGNIYNQSTSVINSNSTSTYKAITDVLSDASAKWLRSLYEAKEVYVRLANGSYIPVTLTTTNYSVQLKKYSSNNNRAEIEFKSDVAGLCD